MRHGLKEDRAVLSIELKSIGLGNKKVLKNSSKKLVKIVQQFLHIYLGPSTAHIINGSKVGLLSRILESLIKVGYPSHFKSFLSDF